MYVYHCICLIENFKKDHAFKNRVLLGTSINKYFMCIHLGCLWVNGHHCFVWVSDGVRKCHPGGASTNVVIEGPALIERGVQAFSWGKASTGNPARKTDIIQACGKIK